LGGRGRVSGRKARLARKLRWQRDWCRKLGSPLYAKLLEAAARDVERRGAAWELLVDLAYDPPGHGLALRLMGAVHRLVLSGRAPLLEPFYPSVGGDANRSGAEEAFLSTLELNRPAIRRLIRPNVQTNEVGRSAALLGGFHSIARETRLPLRLLELGASAGLNLRWDHFHFESGRSAWGKPNSPVKFQNVFVGRAPRLDARVRIVERAGSDLHPVNPSTRQGGLTLLSYTWADQTARLRQLRAALRVARAVPARVDRADAPLWLPAKLAVLPTGAATVVFHSIFMPYVSRAGRRRIKETLKKAGRGATNSSPLAWLRMEAGGDQAEIRLTLWPGGEERLLAQAGFHGLPVRWLAE